MPFFIKATSMALDQYPVLNSVLDEENFTVTLKVEILSISDWPLVQYISLTRRVGCSKQLDPFYQFL